MKYHNDIVIIAECLSVWFDDINDVRRCLAIFEHSEQDQDGIKIKCLDVHFLELTKKLKTNASLAFITAVLMQAYFYNTEREEEGMLFEKIRRTTEKIQQNSTEADRHYIVGYFTCLLSGTNISAVQNFDVPEQVQDAVTFIEKEDFIVHLMKRTNPQ